MDQNLYLEMGWLTAPLNTVPKARALMSPLGYPSDPSMFEEFVFPLFAGPDRRLGWLVCM